MKKTVLISLICAAALLLAVSCESTNQNTYTESRKITGKGNAEIREDINTIELLWSVGDITFKKTDKPYITISEDEKKHPLNYEISLNKLSIRTFDSYRLYTGKENNLVIEIPESIEFLNLAVTCGSLTDKKHNITFDGIKASTLSLNSSFYNVKFTDTTVTNTFDVRFSYGKFEVEKSKLKYCTIITNHDDIYLDTVSLFTIEARTQLGKLIAKDIYSKSMFEGTADKIFLKMKYPSNVTLNCHSVEMEIPENTDFQASLNFVSPSDVTTDFEFQKTGNTLIHGNGNTVFKINTSTRFDKVKITKF